MSLAIGFDKVSKQYRIGSGTHSLREALTGLVRRSNRQAEDRFIWALKDVSFEAQPGEAIGIIGPNGAGKTTILKILSKVTFPTSGAVSINGRVSALIELGAGFHPDLTGRENVYLDGTILGLNRRELDRRFDEIVAFAELEDFIDTPVKHYSSGMYARLGYAVAAHVDPDILLVDEVLAVGDMSFQEKCMRHMNALRAQGKTVVLVTHSLYRVEALCDRALWLDRGHVRSWDGALDVVRAYLDSEERKILATEAEGTKMQAEGAGYPVVVERVELLDSQGISSWEFAFGGGMIVRIHYVAQRRIERPLFNLRILHSGQGVMEASMLIDGYGPEWIEGRGVVECYFDRLPLTPKVYDILLFARSADGVADIIHMDTYARFRVTDAGLRAILMDGPMALNHLRQGSPVYVPRTWRFYSGNETTCTLESNYDDHR